MTDKTEHRQLTIENWGYTRVFRKDKHVLLQLWHASWYSCYKPGDKTLIRK